MGHRNLILLDVRQHGKTSATAVKSKYDLTFKLVFAEHKDLMMSLLNALLPLAENAPIESIEYFPYAFKFLT